MPLKLPLKVEVVKPRNHARWGERQHASGRTVPHDVEVVLVEYSPVGMIEPE